MANLSTSPGDQPLPSARDIRVPSNSKKGITKPEMSPTALAAQEWWDFGFRVIPVVAGEKVTAVKWDPWLDSLSAGSIAAHWSEHPNDDVGCILGTEIVVFDCDSPAAEQAMLALEESFGIKPALVVKTSKGTHRYYRLAPGTYAKSDAHSTAIYPHRIDVKTGRALVVLPPSGWRTVIIKLVVHVEQLPQVGQDFIDAVALHNGRPAPRPYEPPVQETTERQASREDLRRLLRDIDPGCGYEDWLHVLMALFHETGGSEEGLELADEWSRKASNYGGLREMEVKWRSFRSGHGRPITVATLIHLARQANPGQQVGLKDESFEPCETIVVHPGVQQVEIAEVATPVIQHGLPVALLKFSLRGKALGIELSGNLQRFVLGELALAGQATVIFASPNSGKTLIVIYLVIRGIVSGSLQANLVFYVNMDDNMSGLMEKLQLAEEYGFHMLADGYEEFQAKNLRTALEEMIETDTASGVVIILDTLKKFTQLMDKSRASDFAALIRRFVLKGGTVIALAHANKHPGADGRVIYAGTSDIVDDFDCAYTIKVVSKDVDNNRCVVEFENFKRRGNVALSAGYSYAPERNSSYSALLASVQPVDLQELAPMRAAIESATDASVINVILACLNEGINTKMLLAESVAERAGVSKRLAVLVLEKYTGNDPQHHHWRYDVKARGAKVFQALDKEPTAPMPPA